MQLTKQHLYAYLMAYNFAKRLKAIKGKFILNQWTIHPEYFILNPNQFLVGLNTHHMPRTHGYAKKGARCFGVHNWGAKGRMNVIIGSLLYLRL